MRYHSLRSPEHLYSFREAVVSGISPDGSLFVPQIIPSLEPEHLLGNQKYSPTEVAFYLLRAFVQEDLSDEQLKVVIREAFHFDLPIKSLPGSSIFIEELFHGPTFAFKDIGARFLAGCLHQWEQGAERITVLVATSGDTGGAVAHAFLGLENIDVVILFPEGKISEFQLQQIAGLGQNIKAVAVQGTFDDCQSLVKQAFADTTLSRAFRLTSANSINIARWLPQMIFHAIAWQYLDRVGADKCIVVPSGNYGNIAAALLLHAMGLSFQKIIAAHNLNDTIPRFLQSNHYEPLPTRATLANAMDVSDPSNFVRFQFLLEKIGAEKVSFQAHSISDEEILKAIADCWNNHQYLLDPHTATGYAIMKKSGQPGVLMATAHPFKFKPIIEKALGFYPEAWELRVSLGSTQISVIPVHLSSLQEILTR